MKQDNAGGAEAVEMESGLQTDMEQGGDPGYDEAPEQEESLLQQLGFKDDPGESLGQEPEGIADNAPGDTDTEEAAQEDTDTEGTAPKADDADGWTPPTREEWEETQQKLALQEGFTEEHLERLMSGIESAETPDDGQPQVDAEGMRQLLTPREFDYKYEVPDDVRDAILVDGDGEAFNTVINEAIRGGVQEALAVAQHNYRIDISHAVMNGVQQVMPIAMAVDKFYQRNPEMVVLDDLVRRTANNMRVANPAANERQLLTATEKTLAPIIARAKKIAGKHANTQTRSKKTLAPAPIGGGQQTTPRQRQNGAPQLDADDINARLEQIHNLDTY